MYIYIYIYLYVCVYIYIYMYVYIYIVMIGKVGFEYWIIIIKSTHAYKFRFQLEAGDSL